MSSTADVVDGISRLIHALDELFKTQTFEALVELVQQLGIGGPVSQGLKAIGTVLEQLVEWIAKLEKVAAIPKMLEALAPTLEQVQGLTTTQEQDMRDAGLDALVPLTVAARALFDVLDRIRRGAEAILKGLFDPEALARLRQSVVDFAATLKAYEVQLMAKPTKKGLPAGKAPALAGATS
ncbi:hypothetical protein [Corallococcus carmarthensis]|uniref:Uncharacterized protein n=1 Tax=Corallococcus carmarthensis TaxID=2316728 RepID=A0A3A8KE20_9BACT|nr:hypothetical protein [Corallococcus carmarthensis]NOK17274.1 hypothetical protein [Corallococcus carmarthensis]RKH05786.1 hypothetical protein D7X32_06745 [Corallococcus carmarthensis]